MTRRPLDHRDRFVLLATLAALLALLPGVPGPVRAMVVLGWALLVPGLAWVRALPVTGPVEQGAVAVTLSLAGLVLVGVGLIATGLPPVGAGAGALAAVAVTGVAVNRPRATDERPFAGDRRGLS